MIVRSSKLSSATNLSPSSTSLIPNMANRLILKVSYAYKTITRANRALAASLKLSLRIDSEGLLSLQFMIPPSRPNGEAHAFIEFKVRLVITRMPKGPCSRTMNLVYGQRRKSMISRILEQTIKVVEFDRWRGCCQRKGGYGLRRGFWNVVSKDRIECRQWLCRKNMNAFRSHRIGHKPFGNALFFAEISLRPDAISCRRARPSRGWSRSQSRLETESADYTLISFFGAAGTAGPARSVTLVDTCLKVPVGVDALPKKAKASPFVIIPLTPVPLIFLKSDT